MTHPALPTVISTNDPQHEEQHEAVHDFYNTHSGTPGAVGHAAGQISVTPTGLVIVTSTDVQAALAQLDTGVVSRLRPRGVYAGGVAYSVNDAVRGPAPYYGTWRCVVATNEGGFSGWSAGRWEHVGGQGYGLASARPSPAGGPAGYRYSETDTTLSYVIEGGAWVSDSPLGSGQILGGPVLFLTSTDVLTPGTTTTDIAGSTLTIPAYAGDVLLRATLALTSQTGTAAANAQLTPQVFLTDFAGNVLNSASETIVQVTAAVSVTHHRRLLVEAILTGPVAAQTLKLRSKIRNTAPAGWSSANLSPGYGGVTTGDPFYAQAAA